MMYGTDYNEKFLVALDEYKKGRLKKFGNEFILLLKKYAQQRPYEFPTFENDLIIGSIVRGNNYSSPPEKMDQVYLAMQSLASRGTYGSTALVKIEQFKTGKLINLDSKIINVLERYVSDRPWEFRDFQQHPMIGSLIAKHFDPNAQSIFKKIADRVSARVSSQKESEAQVVSMIEEPSFPPSVIENEIVAPVVKESSVAKSGSIAGDWQLFLGLGVATFLAWYFTKNKGTQERIN